MAYINSYKKTLYITLPFSVSCGIIITKRALTMSNFVELAKMLKENSIDVEDFIILIQLLLDLSEE